MSEQFLIGSNYADTSSDLNLNYATTDLRKQDFTNLGFWLRKCSELNGITISFMSIKVNDLPLIDRHLLTQLQQRNFERSVTKG